MRGPRGGCGRCPYTRVTVAASKRGGGRGEGGASAVEAGQSCSRHQGRHFLWRERDRREGKTERLVMIHIQRKLSGFFSFLFHFSFIGSALLRYAAVGMKNM